MSETPKMMVVCIDDKYEEEPMFRSLEKELGVLGIGINYAGSIQEFQRMFEKGDFGRTYRAAIVDLDLQSGDRGEDVIRQIHTEYPMMPIVVLSILTDLNRARKCGELGAGQYIQKERQDWYQAARVIASEIEKAELRIQQVSLLDTFQETGRFGELIGRSNAMKEVFHKIVVAASHERSPVLLVGEPGTGKDVVAREIHKRSARASQVMMARSCAVDFSATDPAIRSGVLRGFGRNCGIKDIPRDGQNGILKLVDGGTLFLDEIGEIPRDIEADFLRILQAVDDPPYLTRFYPAVGEPSEISSDVRYVFASSKPLKELEERLSPALFRRVVGYVIELPPLRNRKEDIPLLSRHFVNKLKSKHAKDWISEDIDPEIVSALSDYDWPNNVGELQRCIEGMVMESTEPHLKKEHLPRKLKIKDDSTRTVVEDKLVEIEISRLYGDAQKHRNPSEREYTIKDVADKYRRDIMEAIAIREDGNGRKISRVLGIPYRSTQQMFIRDELGGFKQYRDGD